MNDFTKSLREKTTEAFRHKYREVDALMIDDIQFISNKTGTQEEFFHTFNDLHQFNKQIIFNLFQIKRVLRKNFSTLSMIYINLINKLF